MQERRRCDWARTAEAIHYHDEEWGRPEHDEARLFELITLEGAQAGLSWDTILRKRGGYRRAFADFDAETAAGYGAAEIERLLADPGIVRHRGKIESTIRNARALLELHASGGSLDGLLWSFVEGRPLVNHWRTLAEIPPRSELSDRMAKELKRRGFRFLGSTTCYALMQAAGLVDDHLPHCFRRTAP